MPVKVHGVTYANAREAAAALGIDADTVHRHCQCGVEGFEFAGPKADDEP